MLWWQVALSFDICLVDANMVKSIGKDAAKFKGNNLPLLKQWN